MVVVPWQVLSFAPLAPCYEGASATIPYAARSRQAQWFPVGQADKQGQPGTGSPLYYVNSFAQHMGPQWHMLAHTFRDRGLGGVLPPRT
jgi:hypothetical protein